MRVLRFLPTFLLLAATASAQDFSSLPRVLGKSEASSSGLEGFSDEAIFECACPGLVEFCKEYQADDARNCVIEMMEAVEEDQYRADKLGLTFQEYVEAPEGVIHSMIATRLGVTVEEYKSLSDDEIDRLAREHGL